MSADECMFPEILDPEQRLGNAVPSGLSEAGWGSRCREAVSSHRAAPICVASFTGWKMYFDLPGFGHGVRPPIHQCFTPIRQQILRIPNYLLALK